MRQIAGSFAEYEKARLVAKLKAARERKRAASPAHKCEGRKSWAEINPELVREAKRLRRRSPKGHQRSLREIAAELAKLGFLNKRGVMFSAASVGPDDYERSRNAERGYVASTGKPYEAGAVASMLARIRIGRPKGVPCSHVLPFNAALWMLFLVLAGT
jgi:hypothetical protein